MSHTQLGGHTDVRKRHKPAGGDEHIVIGQWSAAVGADHPWAPPTTADPEGDLQGVRMSQSALPETDAGLSRGAGLHKSGHFGESARFGQATRRQASIDLRRTSSGRLTAPAP